MSFDKDCCKQIDEDNYVVELSFEKELEEAIQNAKKNNKPLILMGPRFSGKTTALKKAIFNGIVNDQVDVIEKSKAKIDEKEKEELKKLIKDNGFRIIEATKYEIKYILGNETTEKDADQLGKSQPDVYGSIKLKLKEYLKKLPKKRTEELKLPDDIIKVEANITEEEAEKIFECYVDEYLKKEGNMTTINRSELISKKDHFIELAYLGEKGKGIFIPQYLKRLIKEHAGKSEEDLKSKKEREKEIEDTLIEFFGIEFADLISYSSNFQNFLESLLPYLRGIIKNELILFLGPASVVITGLTLFTSFKNRDKDGGLDKYIEAYRAWNEMPQEKREALCSLLDEKYNLPPGSSCEFLFSWLSKDEIEIREKLREILDELFSKIKEIEEELDKLREEFYARGTIKIKSEKELTEKFESVYGISTNEKTLVGIKDSEQDKEITKRALEIIDKASNKPVLIVGEPGAGKSTLLYIVGRELLKQGKRLYLIEDFAQFSPIEFSKLGDDTYAIFDVGIEVEAEEIKKEIAKLSRGHRSVHLIVAIRSSFLKDFKSVESVNIYDITQDKKIPYGVLLEIARRNLKSIEALTKEQAEEVASKLVEKSEGLPLYISEAVKKISQEIEKRKVDDVLNSLPDGISALILNIIDAELGKSSLLLLLYYLISHYPNFPEELISSAEALFKIPKPIYINELPEEGVFTLHSWYKDITDLIFQGKFDELNFDKARVNKDEFKDKVEKVQKDPFLLNNAITAKYIDVIEKTLGKKKEVLKVLKEEFEDFIEPYSNGDSVSLTNLADLMMLFLIFHSVITKLKKKSSGKGFFISKERIDPKELDEKSHLYYAKLIGFLLHTYLKNLEEEEVNEETKINRPFYALGILYTSRLLNDKLAKRIDEEFLGEKEPSINLEDIAKYYPDSKDRLIRYYIPALATLLKRIGYFETEKTRYLKPHEFLEGLLLFCKGKFEEAIEKFDEAINTDKNKAEYHFYKGKALRQLKRYEEAIEEFNKAIKLDGNNRDYHIDKGITLSLMKRYEEAIEEFNKALESGKKDDDPRLHYYKGITLSEMKKLDDAIKEFDEAIRLDKEDPDYHIKKGIALNSKKMFDHAIKEFDEAIRLDPINPQAHFNRMLALFNKEGYDKAIQEFDIAIKVKPHDPRYHYRKGLALRRTGKFDNAIKEFDEAIRLDPNNPNYHFEKSTALNQLAYSKVSEGDVEEAKKYYEESLNEIEKALSHNSNNPRYLFTKGIALKGLGKIEEALKFVQEALNRMPGDPDFLIVHAALKADLGSPEEGIRKVKRAVEAGKVKIDKLCEKVEKELGRNPVEKERNVLSDIKKEICANEGNKNNEKLNKE